jgi:ribulose 1,5-bisphosphate carboxylase large subunit-like protein
MRESGYLRARASLPVIRPVARAFPRASGGAAWGAAMRMAAQERGAHKCGPCGGGTCAVPTTQRARAREYSYASYTIHGSAELGA